MQRSASYYFITKKSQINTGSDPAAWTFSLYILKFQDNYLGIGKNYAKFIYLSKKGGIIYFPS